MNLDEVRGVKFRPNYTLFSINKPDQLPNAQFTIYLKGLPVRDSNSESGLAQYFDQEKRIIFVSC
jgi:hypothetical protein